jgi:hypothetical protein
MASDCKISRRPSCPVMRSAEMPLGVGFDAGCHHPGQLVAANAESAVRTAGHGGHETVVLVDPRTNYSRVI